MQFPMVSFKLAAISLMGMQLVTQAIAIPIDSQPSSALESRGLFTGAILGGIAAHYYDKHQKEEHEEDDDEVTTKKSKKADKE
ncbi:hypothetical protein OnM2_080056 [Erysiphe neolycopersici]|uniref:Uncharacterized protein n=1 Tax=Erysiphe neolycopersici TaxID=212602 RepID=A0A420HGN3_9PEZI|nr:hypothetical protein OnM2_080056 [Erysiphe neolycopersici]